MATTRIMGSQQEHSDRFGVPEEFAHDYIEALPPGTAPVLPDRENCERVQTSTRLLIISNSSGLIVPASRSALALEISSAGLPVDPLRIKESAASWSRRGRCAERSAMPSPRAARYTSRVTKGRKQRKNIQTAFHQPFNLWSRKRSPMIAHSKQVGKEHTRGEEPPEDIPKVLPETHFASLLSLGVAPVAGAPGRGFSTWLQFRGR